jgi:hypothetical protein
MATPSYDPKKAALANKLIQQGLDPEAALAQAGVTSDTEINNYAVGTNGVIGANSTLPISDAERANIRNQAAFEREQQRLPGSLRSADIDEDPSGNPAQQPSPKNTSYTNTSTTEVSGGGSTTRIAAVETPTAASRALQPAIDAKQAELEQFTRDNPSNLTRKRLGLPRLTPEENQKRIEKQAELISQKQSLESQQLQATVPAPGTGATITTPNTTTTTQTVTTGTTSVNTPVQSPGGSDPAVNQQTESQLGTAVGASNIRSAPANVETNESVSTPPPTEVAESVFDPDGIDARLEAEQARIREEEGAAIFAPNPVLGSGDEAIDAANEAELAQLREAEGAAIFAPNPVLGSGDEALDAANEAELAQLREAEGRAIFSPAPVPPSQAGPIGVAYDDDGNLMPGYTLDEDNNPVFVGGDFVEPATAASAEASRTAAATNRAQNQSTLQTRQSAPAAADWRVRLRLAPNADYLYKVSGNPGILAPLAATDGVIFPYTPTIETSYQAKYDSYDLTHSNYRGYFYKNSMVENISIKGTFTAQDTKEAQYLLAVIHFFKSVTKMFYGQDAQAGTPPPLVYLSGFGKYQFNESPCVVTNFGYSLPNDVDYIRADGFNNIGLNMENRRSQSSGPAPGGSLGTVIAIIDRLSNAGLKNGSLSNRPSPGQVNQNVSNQTSINSTYVPTKMEISLTLLPMQTRNQVSKQFSLKSFANGSLLAGGGFW